MKINFNGQTIEIAENTTLLCFVKDKGIVIDGSAASVNDSIVPKSTWSTFVLLEGMKVDVFTLVAGG